MEIRVAAVQHAPVFLNLDASVDLACKLIAEAAEGGAKVVAFGETWLPGYPVWVDRSPRAAIWNEPGTRELYRLLLENSIKLPGPHLDKMLKAAHDTGTDVVIGSQERDGNTVYNTQLILSSDGKTWFPHRKLVPTYNERLVWGRGDGSTLDTLDAEYGTLGGLICWEHWMPLARAAMHAKEEVIHVSQWPGASELHQIASRHYAFEGMCFVIAAALHITPKDVLEGFDSLGVDEPGARAVLEALEPKEDGTICEGGSSIIAPDTRYITEPVYEPSTIVYGDLRLDERTEGGLVLDTDGHYSRPDIFQLLVNTRPLDNVIEVGKQ